MLFLYCQSHPKIKAANNDACHTIACGEAAEISRKRLAPL
jgi:hypothetical protein